MSRVPLLGREGAEGEIARTFDILGNFQRRQVNSTRVRVEHSIGRLKRYARLADPYDNTIGLFNCEFNVITGLVNLHLLWDRIDKGPLSPGRWEIVIDWNGTILSAGNAPF